MPWFEICEAGPGTFALLEPNHYEEVISYLIVGDESAVLLDTGMGIGNIRAEVERLTDRPIVVVNSHSHYDHVGDNHRFSEVWAFDDDLEVARIECGLGPPEAAQFLAPGSYCDPPPDFDPASYEIRPSPVTRRLHDLETIELGNRTLTIYHTPGHSPGSICLHDTLSGILFTGDTLYPGTLYAHFGESDLGAYRLSLARLDGILDDVSHLCPAHNEASVGKALVVSVRDGFEEIAAGVAEFGCCGGARVYAFDGFRVALSGDG
jgi:glyoxylase-like metal-dependent hydrolase (beta-lactamase superfamily II)